MYSTTKLCKLTNISPPTIKQNSSHFKHNELLGKIFTVHYKGVLGIKETYINKSEWTLHTTHQKLQEMVKSIIKKDASIKLYNEKELHFEQIHHLSH